MNVLAYLSQLYYERYERQTLFESGSLSNFMALLTHLSSVSVTVSTHQKSTLVLLSQCIFLDRSVHFNEGTLTTLNQL